MTPASILFIGKADDPGTQRALEHCRSMCANVEAHVGRWGDRLPQSARTWSGDLIVSYLSRWVVPAPLLERARIAAINFHPAPPEYPGIGCINFALYNEVAQYGVTCHHMAPRVDTGALIAVRRFPVLESDSVGTLLDRTYEHQLELFRDVLDALWNTGAFPVSSERWTRAPYTRAEFDALGVLTPSMDAGEVRRRVRATQYGPYGPSLEFHGFRFVLPDSSAVHARPAAQPAPNTPPVRA
ncbi:MAG: formyltransferase family protein [Gemmatimonadaceae bacterium]